MPMEDYLLARWRLRLLASIWPVRCTYSYTHDPRQLDTWYRCGPPAFMANTQWKRRVRSLTIGLRVVSRSFVARGPWILLRCHFILSRTTLCIRRTRIKAEQCVSGLPTGQLLGVRWISMTNEHSDPFSSLCTQ